MVRKLAAIVAADVVGYSRMMGADEAGTHDAMKRMRAEVIDPLLARHAGRIVKTTGDGLLAEFSSVVEAVSFAAALQSSAADRASTSPVDRRIAYRIGVNVGDVIVEAEDLFGDGVNVAARLEQVAEPGAVYVSGDAYAQVRNKLPGHFVDLGTRSLKNIAEPIRIYRYERDRPAPGTTAVPTMRGLFRARPARTRRLAVLGAVGLLIIVAGVAIVEFRRTAVTPRPAQVGGSTGQVAHADTPSIAVLPFTNLSGDPQQDYIGDGIAEDLITDLSRVPALLVIARNSVFVYKGKAVDVAEVARALGVRYVVEGSVRTSGKRIRVSAKLIDGQTRGELWAERYDREMTEIFALQDELTNRIVRGLVTSMGAKEIVASRRGTRNVEAYSYFLRGREFHYLFTGQGAERARAMFEKAVALDPTYADAVGALGLLYLEDWRLWGVNRDASLKKALELGEQAIRLDPSLPSAHMVVAQVRQFLGDHQEAGAEADKVLALAPTDSETLSALGWFLRNAGRPAEAIVALEKAIRVEPNYPSWYAATLGSCYTQLGRYDEAIAILEKGFDQSRDYIGFPLFLTSAYYLSGREADARAAAAAVLRLNPSFTISGMLAYLPYRNRADLDENIRAYRAAGLPD